MCKRSWLKQQPKKRVRTRTQGLVGSWPLSSPHGWSSSPRLRNGVSASGPSPPHPFLGAPLPSPSRLGWVSRPGQFQTGSKGCSPLSTHHPLSRGTWIPSAEEEGLGPQPHSQAGTGRAPPGSLGAGRLVECGNRDATCLGQPPPRRPRPQDLGAHRLLVRAPSGPAACLGRRFLPLAPVRRRAPCQASGLGPGAFAAAPQCGGGGVCRSGQQRGHGLWQLQRDPRRRQPPTGDGL